MPERGNAKDKIKCPFCGSLKVWRRGFQPSLTGLKRRCQCYDCGKTFFRPKTETAAKATRAKATKSKATRRKKKA